MEVIGLGKRKGEPKLCVVSPMRRSDMAAYMARAFQSDGAIVLLVDIEGHGGFRVRTGEHNLSDKDVREALCLAISLTYAETTEVVENVTTPPVDKDTLE